MSRAVDRVYVRLHHVLMRPGRRQTAVDRFVVRSWTRLDVAGYKRFGFSVSASLMGVDVLLLRTVGRRTGKPREVLIACTVHEGRLIVGGGNWGWDRDPGWVHNAIAHPQVEIVRKRRVESMLAVLLTGDDAQAANDALARAYPHSQVYVERRSRPITTVRLDPIS
jgi:deazaflavin-dependent oxidoreductase (nitroreductase family)